MFCYSWQKKITGRDQFVRLCVLSIKLLHVDTTNTHSYNSTEPVLKKLVLTWLVAQYVHGGHKLFASLFILALLIKQTSEIHIVVWIILRQLLNQSLEKQYQIFQQNKQSFMWSDGDSFSTWKKERVWNGMRVKKWWKKERCYLCSRKIFLSIFNGSLQFDHLFRIRMNNDIYFFKYYF